MDYNKLAHLSSEIGSLETRKVRLSRDIEMVIANEKYNAWVEIEFGEPSSRGAGTTKLYSVSREAVLESMENHMLYLKDKLEEKKKEFDELLNGSK